MTKKQKSMRCQVTGTDGVRRNFKFSDVTRKDTLEGYKRKLKSLVLAKKLGDIPPQDMNWISDQDDSMTARLVPAYRCWAIFLITSAFLMTFANAPG